MVRVKLTSVLKSTLTGKLLLFQTLTIRSLKNVARTVAKKRANFSLVSTCTEKVFYPQQNSTTTHAHHKHTAEQTIFHVKLHQTPL